MLEGIEVERKWTRRIVDEERKGVEGRRKSRGRLLMGSDWGWDAEGRVRDRLIFDRVRREESTEEMVTERAEELLLLLPSDEDSPSAEEDRRNPLLLLRFPSDATPTLHQPEANSLLLPRASSDERSCSTLARKGTDLLERVPTGREDANDSILDLDLLRPTRSLHLRRRLRSRFEVG